MQRAEAGKEETGHEPGRKVNLQIHKELLLGTVFGLEFLPYTLFQGSRAFSHKRERAFPIDNPE